MAKGSSFPILGYLCSTMVPSKSTAIVSGVRINYWFFVRFWIGLVALG
jgi:hypothetical protein